MNTFYFRAFATVVIQPQRETKHQTTACSLTPVGMSERIRRAKARKLVDWDNGSLIGKANTAHTSKAKQGIHSSLPIGRQVFSHLYESTAPLCVTVTWEDKRHHSKRLRLPSFPPCFLCWARRHMVWGTPLVSWGQLSWLCPLPTPCASSAHSLVGWCERQKRPWLCVSTAQQ